ncbi:MAG: single-stranded DNA-binding protein [Parcubacteria group bacterium]|nr:single-stranded DNA-binding protein [Parcubacteria group bacterium]
MYLNKAFLYGNLTKDPEIKALPSGVKVASFGLATSRNWKDKNGVKQESTVFHNIVMFGVQADLAAQYLKKGKPIFVEGRIENRSWDGPDGTKKYRSEVVVENFQFGPTPMAAGTGASYSAPANTPPKPVSSAPAAGKKEPDTIEYPEEEINLEDIPF